MTSYVPLSMADLIIAAALVALNGAISFAYGLKLEKSLTIASLRMIVQLAIVALVLKFIFAQTSACRINCRCLSKIFTACTK